MKFPDEVQIALAARWRAGHRQWLIDINQNNWPMAISLGVPLETQAIAQRSAVADWVHAWRSWRGPGEVQWCERRWRVLGLQSLPQKLLIKGPGDLATLVGEAERWRLAQARCSDLVSKWPELSQVLPRYYELLANESEAGYRRLVAMLSWLLDNPASGLYPRQVPVPGVDSKWLERHSGILCTWIAQLSDQHAGVAMRLPGLKSPPHLLRLLILDPELRRRVGGLRDLAAPFSDLAQLDLPARHVLIVENLQSALALPDLPGSVAFAALGKGVAVLQNVPWLDRAEVYYWGDIDSHGLHILNLARRVLPGVRALLMNEATLLEHKDLWGKEDQSYLTDDLDALEPSERRLFRDLIENRWGQQVRLEQERIEWKWVEKSLAVIRDGAMHEVEHHQKHSHPNCETAN